LRAWVEATISTEAEQPDGIVQWHGLADLRPRKVAIDENEEVCTDELT